MSPRTLYKPEKHDQQVIELHRRGFLDWQIGAVMGFSSSTIHLARKRLGLGPHHPRKPCEAEKGAPIPKDPPNPVQDSKAILERLGRLDVRPGSGFWLDKRPVSTRDMVRAANMIRKAWGMEQLGPPHWRVP